MYSRANRCRVRTEVRLQVLNASLAASTARSNSEEVVSGTRESRVCVDCDSDHQLRPAWGSMRSYRIQQIHPRISVAIEEFSPDVVFDVLS